WPRPEGTRLPIYHADREDEVPPMGEQGVPAEEVTLAEVLKERGYHTLALGKWHLGSSETLRPTAQGFDEFLGFYPGGQMFADPEDPRVVNSKQDFDPIDRFLWANLPFAVRKDAGPRFTPGDYMTDYLSDEAVRAIEANRNRPFFMYLAYNAPHTPLQATKADYDALAHIEDHTLRVYGGMIRALDRGIGEVMAALRERGLEENTLVLFSSDNGGANYVGLPDLNRPYRGWKMTFFEGGLRTPFFVKWPAALPKGTRFAEPVAHVDVFATAAGAAGARVPSDRPMDGVDLIPYLKGDVQGPPHESLYWRSGHYQTLLSGGWKLQVAERPDQTWLFDLGADPTERDNVAAGRADKVAELKALLAELNAEMSEPAWPSLIEGPIVIDRPLNTPAKAGEEYVYWPN
ncbi:MAG: sulfatase-like hydrolase/transferase, partial [Deltaproteobacteria bacterium]|nr:sulfatase-like hydrolase/transferase [Deltaproteobacteria bacterium]